MSHQLNVSVAFPTSLLDLESACATARDAGMDDDASVNANIFTASLTISMPGQDITQARD